MGVVCETDLDHWGGRLAGLASRAALLMCRLSTKYLLALDLVRKRPMSIDVDTKYRTFWTTYTDFETRLTMNSRIQDHGPATGLVIRYPQLRHRLVVLPVVVEPR